MALEKTELVDGYFKKEEYFTSNTVGTCSLSLR
jgi:hypothetical protein